MRTKVAIAVALALTVVGGCSRPWQASTAELAPLNAVPYGQEQYSQSYDPTSQYADPLTLPQSGYAEPYPQSRPQYSNPYPPSQSGYTNPYPPSGSRYSDPYPLSPSGYNNPYPPSGSRYSDPNASSQYRRVPSSNGYEQGSPKNSYGPVSKTSQYAY